MAYFGICIVRVEFTEECNWFGRYWLAAGPLLESESYQLIYNVWLSNILFVFLPFLILTILNALIFIKLSRQSSNRDSLRRYQMEEGEKFHAVLKHKGHIGSVRNESKPGFRLHRKERKLKSREATIVLLVVVLVFLICNAPSVALTLIEHISQDFLQENRDFYAFARDVINLLTVINSSANFVVYWIFGKEFRRELKSLLKCEDCRSRKSSDVFSDTSNTFESESDMTECLTNGLLGAAIVQSDSGFETTPEVHDHSFSNGNAILYSNNNIHSAMSCFSSFASPTPSNVVILAPQGDLSASFAESLPSSNIGGRFASADGHTSVYNDGKHLHI